MTNILSGWNFDNSYSRLPEIFYSSQNPTQVSSPELIVFNSSLAAKLGLNEDSLKQKNGVDVFAGNELPEGAFPLAQAYAGHQFGHFTMLGDGRAILLGEQITPSNERFDIQLKGSGRTPYSRGGDGRATLGPMLREYIISEAMHGLGIPTTRSLAVVTTGETVMREAELPGAILTRIAASHLRFGTFQYASKWGTTEDVKALADYAIERHYPHIQETEHRYLSLLQEVINRQAALVTKWQLVGFIHGVMNTDNMTISGETIDYGPCAFMDTYDPETVFSSIDRQGRYAYGNQPKITAWNLARFAETLLPLLHEDQEQAVTIAQDEISQFPDLFQSYWLNGMRSKLGIVNEETGDDTLIEGLLSLMKKHGADYTNTFRALTLKNHEEEQSVLFRAPEFSQWYKLWQDRLGRQDESKEASLELMKQSNPGVIPRNHRVEEALEAAVTKSDFSVMENLLNVLKKPYTYSQDQTDYCKPAEPSKYPYQTFCGT
ncbi:selenoprotein O and cysteine-containing homologs [Halalkalibacter wakoensis JCM 9140]|uniref:Protein nucleotidyltransferase YdiU n=1 Tax=Halalkalibacter wakoensis JCM 9140 TaxID=1236970 RepID=W4Q962_9BACI|nr:YdiU family protein [Halalkalibacter wakoensis]GAE28535.1 selenoprotein O and cysteine-containing homologs [Halalkalibacter wakoensis JCM 9140]